MLPAKVVAATKQAEECHGKTLFYSDEISSEAKIQIGNKAAIDGFCPGFNARWKQFTVQTTSTPSTALGNFMGDTESVVAECEGFIQAVIFTAIREIFASDILFDAVFYDLKIGDMNYIKPFFSVTLKPADESNVALGDWVYLSRTPGQSMQDFQDHAIKPGRAERRVLGTLSALLQDPPKKYVGFG